MNYTYQEIPTANIIGMSVTAVLSVLVPIILLIVWKKKKNADFAPFLIGVATFIVFLMILESLMHRLVLNSGKLGSAITGNIFLYALYGGLAAGIFEEVGRFVAMKLFMKENLTRENSIMLGIGHGGIEAIILGGLNSISNIVLSLMISIMGIDFLFASIPENLRDTVYAQISPLWTSPATYFFIAAFERMLAICIHLCCSYIVYRAVSGRKISCLFLAILIHALIDGALVIVASLSGIVVAEAVLTVMAVVLAVFTIRNYRTASSAPAAVPPVS